MSCRNNFLILGGKHMVYCSLCAATAKIRPENRIKQKDEGHRSLSRGESLIISPKSHQKNAKKRESVREANAIPRVYRKRLKDIIIREMRPVLTIY